MSCCCCHRCRSCPSMTTAGCCWSGTQATTTGGASLAARSSGASHPPPQRCGRPARKSAPTCDWFACWTAHLSCAHPSRRRPRHNPRRPRLRMGKPQQLHRGFHRHHRHHARPLPSQRAAPHDLSSTSPGAPVTGLYWLRPGFRSSLAADRGRAHPSWPGIGSASAARQAGAVKGSAKYWVSCVTRSPVNSMTLSVQVGTPS